jgi:hypothetical protein
MFRDLGRYWVQDNVHTTTAMGTFQHTGLANATCTRTITTDRAKRPACRCALGDMVQSPDVVKYTMRVLKLSFGGEHT